MGNLPARFTTFVGRRQQVVELRRLLGTTRLVTLTGAGGVGKTRLALETAAVSVKAFPDGVWLVDLASVHDPEAVAGVVASALNVPDQGGQPVLEHVALQLARRRVLLVLDNCEHLVDVCARLVHTLLSAVADLRVLATSREPLGLTGEQVFPVRPLDHAEAMELLRDRVGAVRPELLITEANRAAVARLCEDLDGVPLAIELAAARLRTLTVEQAAQRLENRFAFLSTGSRTARPNQRSLRAAIEWSWELCSPAERLLWQRLSVFAGSFGLDAVETVCADDGMEKTGVLYLLDRLIAQSVVEHADPAGLPRYRLLESIREYGWERLRDSGEAELLLWRHRDFFRDLAEHLHQDWVGPRQQEILSRFRAEHRNLLTALEYHGPVRADTPAVHGMDAADPRSHSARHVGSGLGGRQARLALAAALRHHWVAGGFLGDGRRQLERALVEAPEPTTVRAHALMTAAYVAQMQGDLTAADQWLDEAEELAERLDDEVMRAHVWGHQGVSELFHGRRGDAVSLMEKAVTAHTVCGDGVGVTVWLVALATVQAVGDNPRAEETRRRALAAADAHGERWSRAHLEMSLGRRAWALGDYGEARTLTLSALRALRGFGADARIAKMVEQLAWITAAGGDHERAGRLLGSARVLEERTGTSAYKESPVNAEYHARCEKAVTRALGRAGYDRAWKGGTALDTPARAIDYALEVDVAAAPPAEPSPLTESSPLTRRERQVAALVSQGMTNRRIAAELVLSPRTVDGHVDRILTKLGYSCRAQVAAWWAAYQMPPGTG
ncbi:ATP-binding protein [Streptomyces fuscichromogenes]|uniref:ATP-binding protein n=1 Tax=Streptomyces fuscichromogenes TaxID=1324013 RepID=UPI003823F600